MKKRDTKQNSLEIDYVKLANAIVNAEEHARKRKAHRHEFRIKAMKFLNGVMYSGVYCVSFVKIYDI